MRFDEAVSVLKKIYEERTQKKKPVRLRSCLACILLKT